jgi:hypothetical protein
MSKYTIYYNNKQQQFRSLASQWKSWSEDFNLTKEQARGMSLFFRHIGKRFGLINEFKDIGVI